MKLPQDSDVIWLIKTADENPLAFRGKLMVFSSEKLAKDFMESAKTGFVLLDCHIASMTWEETVKNYKHFCKTVALDMTCSFLNLP